MTGDFCLTENMKRSEAARYARWSAGAAAVLAVVTAGVYMERGWKARRERKNAPAAAAANVSRQSNGLNFSKVEGNHKVFTVDASKSTDFKDRDLTELEAVVITIYGKNGDRHDVIHTQSCQYGKSDGNVVCSGAVSMDLQSAADAERSESPAGGGIPNIAPQVMHVETKAVTFNRASGAAATAAPVAFTFPNGSGQGVGMEYKSEAGTVKLLKEVKLKLRQPENSATATGPRKAKAKSAVTVAADSAADEEVTVTGTNLDFDRTTRRMHIQGPASAATKTTQLTAGELTMDLDALFRAQSLLASGNVNGAQPQMISRGKAGQMDMSADRLTAKFAPQGWVTSVEADGQVKSARQSEAERDDASAANGMIVMWPRLNEVKELNLHGSVVLKAQATATGDARLLHTEALRMEFSGGKANEASRPLKAETLAAGRMEWTDSSGRSITGIAPANTSSLVKNTAGGGKLGSATTTPGVAHTMLAADKLQLAFGALGKPKQLMADGHVQTERTLEGKPAQTATAQSGVAQLLATGGWSQMDLNGQVRLREGERNGQSDHAVFRRAEETATLTGRALVRDANTETVASRIVFQQNTGDIHAEGSVRSTDLPGRRNAVQLAPDPTHITADVLQANSQTGRAFYTGHARMWQGESVLEADGIELLRETRVMNANGNIRAAFPQTAAAAPASAAAVVNTAADSAPPKKSNLWHVTAQSLVYTDMDGHAHLEHDVVAQSVEQKMRAPIVDLYFTRANSAVASSTALPRGAAGQVEARGNGPQQISKAVGTGGVIVEEGGRKAVAEHGVYTASDGKFVMSGGTPTLYDGLEGNTTGRQLTFFLADDTIIVDSENGSRILTKHRVDK
jgi:LPS export ABC transporter protein LptC